MGTLSLTIIKERWEGKATEEIVVMYRQYDGNVIGHGRELTKFLKSFTVVNGLGQNSKKVAYGGGCLAAQIVAKFKKTPGGFYLHPAGTRDIGEEYRYTVICENDSHTIHLQIEHGYSTMWKTIFDGDVKAFNARKVEKIESAE